MSRENLSRAWLLASSPYATTRQLAEAILELTAHLKAVEMEEQEQQAALPASSPTTASRTTASPSDVLDGPTQVVTPASSHPLGDPTEAELTHVVQCSVCLVRLASWWGSYKTLAQDVAGTMLTLARQESSPSAAGTEPAPSPSPASPDPVSTPSEECEHDWELATWIVLRRVDELAFACSICDALEIRRAQPQEGNR